MIGQCLATFCSFLANFSLSYVWLTSSKLIFNFVFVSLSSRSMVPVLINHQHQCEQLSKTKLPFGGKYIFCFTSRLLLLKKPFPQTHPSVTLSFISYYPSLFLLFCILLLLCVSFRSVFSDFVFMLLFIAGGSLSSLPFSVPLRC